MALVFCSVLVYDKTMNDGGDGAERAAAEFLARFNGDTAAAHRALTRYSLDRQSLHEKKSKRPQSDEVVVEVTDLIKTYKLGKQHITAVNGVSLAIHKGEFIALTGPSGSGKSTLLQLIGGLDKPTGGSVVVQGKALEKLHDKNISEFRNRTIGFVFQFFYLQPFLKLRQNLEVAGMPLRTKRTDRRKRVEELAQLVGLSERLDHLPKELSGGQMQRAAIARALLNEPSIILADEPTGNLDSTNGAAVIDLFEKIRDELDTTVIVVTHDPLIAARADRVVTLKDGVIV